MPKPSQNLFIYHLKSNEIFLRKKGSGGLNKKRKEGFLTALATEI